MPKSSAHSDKHSTVRQAPMARRTFLAQAGTLAGGVALAASLSLSAAPAQADNHAKAAAGTLSAQYAYVGSRTTKQRKAQGEGIEVYRFDPKSGSLEHIQQVAGLVNPSYLVLDDAQRHLYAVHGDTSMVSAFAINPENGHLTKLNTEYSGGSNPVHLTLDADNKFLTLANYATGSLGVLPVMEDGSLGALIDLAELKGEPGPHRKQQSSAHPHQVQYDPSKQWIVSPDKGLDAIFVHRLDTAKPGLVAAEGSPVKTREGAGPRHIAFHPSLPFGYVANELDNSIATYSFDSKTGALKPLQILPTLPADYVGDNTTSGIFTSPDGRYVYISNRGHDSIAIFAIDQTSGLLKPVAIEPTQGKQPRFFTFDPSGNWLFAANEKSHTLVPFKVDKKSGRLTQQGAVIETGSPVAMVFTH